MFRLISFSMLVVLVGCATQIPAGSVSQNPADSVRIVRDEYGVPHVYADSVYGLYYGYGYAIAQDRLFQMEMSRRSTQGTVAAALGEDYVEYDKYTRALFDPGSIRRQIALLQPRDWDIFDGYAAGINAWLAEVRSAPDSLLPKQFVDFDITPTDWSNFDVAMIFIGTMNNRYGDYNTELENAAILADLTRQHGETQAQQLFDLLNPRFTTGAPTTIPAEDWSRPAYDSMAASLVEKSDVFGVPGITDRGDVEVVSGFSNCFVVGKDKLVDGGSVLINGPQFGWFNPSYVYSVGLHGPGIDVAGNTPFGYPMIMFGHNATISWGSTWGASDIVDIYAEQLADDDTTRYLHDGEYVDMEHRVERIAVRGGDDILHDVYRSVHGPIIRVDPEAGFAFSKRRSWEGRELETLLAWLYATWAPDFDTWKEQAEKSAINVNMYFADVNGNIGYFHGGRFPRRVSGHDNRFPVTGNGSMEWQGRQPVDTANPHVMNPSGGFLANWNNKPGEGVMNPDFFFYSWSAADRVEVLQELLSSRDKFTPDEAWSVIESSSYADVHARYFLPLIDAAVAATSDARLKEANAVLQRWSRESRDSDSDGYYDEAGTALFRTFIQALIDRVLADDLGESYQYFGGSGYPTAENPTSAGTNIQPGLKAVYEAIATRSGTQEPGNTGREIDIFNGESVDTVLLQSLADALAQITADDDVAIGDVRLAVAEQRFLQRNFLGIPQAGESERLRLPIEQNRGTENNMIVMQPGNIVAWEVTPPGQSAFVSQNGQKSPHYDDQLEMFGNFQRKRVWFYADDVEASKRSEIVLRY